MRRWIKNFIVIASLFLVSCNTAPLPPDSTAASADLVEVSHTVEVRNAFGDILEVFDAPKIIGRINIPISHVVARGRVQTN